MRFRDLRGIDFSNGKTAICDVKKRLFQNLINTSVYEDFCDPFRENSQKQSPEPIRKIAFCRWDFAKSENLCFAEEKEGFWNTVFVHSAPLKQSLKHSLKQSLKQNGNDRITPPPLILGNSHENPKMEMLM